jgi:signal peptidase II
VRKLQAARGTPLNGNNIVVPEADDTGAPVPAGQPPANRPPDDLQPAGHGKVRLVLVLALIVLTADIISKSIVVATLTGRPNVHLLGGFLQLTETRNPGAAFSIGGPSTTILFTAIAVGVIAFILRTSRRIRSTAWAITLGLLLGGATGNLTDRILRWPGPFRGYVVDWIQVPHWPVFNVADSCIVCGGILAVFLAMRNVRIDGTRPPAPGSQPARGDHQGGDEE